MSLIKFNNSLFPWTNEGFKSFFNDDFFTSDLLSKDSLMPAMNIKDRESDFEIEFAAPGFTKEDFEITVDDNVLTVSGEKKSEKEEKEDDYTRKEFNYNSFKRSLSLPKNIDTDKEIKATYLDGILKLSINKKEVITENNKRTISVQ